MIVSIAAGSLTDVIMRAAANELQPAARPAGRHREPRRRGRHSGRAGLRAVDRRRPHGVRGVSQPAVLQPGDVHQPALRRRQGPDPDHAAVLPDRVARGASRRSVVKTVAELKALAQSQDAGAQLGHARRGLGARVVPALDQQPVGNRDRRHSLSRRRPDGAGAGRQRDPGRGRRPRQFPGPRRRRQGQGDRRLGAEALRRSRPTS